MTAYKESPFFDLYLRYMGDTEVPTIFHRWTAVSMVATLLERNVWIPLGHHEIYPNMYIILSGAPGTRKGTAINMGLRLLKDWGYEYFGPNKVSKETLWSEMMKIQKQIKTAKLTDDPNFIAVDLDAPVTQAIQEPATPIYIALDEFTDFIGSRDPDFLDNLTTLWDNLDKFTHPKQDSLVYIPKPTVNILSGTTPTNMSTKLNRLAVGTGFTSRILFIYSEPTELKIPFPEPPNDALRLELLKVFTKIRQLEGPMQLTQEVKNWLSRLYKRAEGLMDHRFQYYNQRRYIHLLKLICVISAMRGSLQPTVEDCIRANTLLYITELRMPEALGEFGLARNSKQLSLVIDFLRSTGELLSAKDIYKRVSRDISSLSELRAILHDLKESGKVRVHYDEGKEYFIPIHDAENNRLPKWSLDFDMFTVSEVPDV